MSDFIGGSCCPIISKFDDDSDPGDALRFSHDISKYIECDSQKLCNLNFLVDGIHCGGCIQTIELGLKANANIINARLNMSTNRLNIKWHDGDCDPLEFIRILARLGYRAVPFDPELMKNTRDQHEKSLLITMAVAGFAASNIMLLSVAIWAGHFSDMGPHTRTLMHWVSALIAIPAVLYAGQPFFKSAIGVLSRGRTNMDVPISLAVILATGMSLSETMRGADHTYFDSAVTLLFFLLIGRYLDMRARSKARSAAEKLLSLNATAITILRDDGQIAIVSPEEITTDMVVIIAAGERISVDGKVINGSSDIDSSLISGETIPKYATIGDKVFAGTISLNGALNIAVDAVGEATLLAEIARLMENAEQRRSKFVAIADKVAKAYAPVVHSLAVIAFIGWFAFGDIGWQQSLMVAVAVLIITCPCALGLAVPIVQVVASGRLLRAGILLKSSSAMERLTVVDTIVFDKTGTLTEGRPELININKHCVDDIILAANAAIASKHPLARAIVTAASMVNKDKNNMTAINMVVNVNEIPGSGLEWQVAGQKYKLGSRKWINPYFAIKAIRSEMFFKKPDGNIIHFEFQDKIKDDAKDIIIKLKKYGFNIELLSGDNDITVESVAKELGIKKYYGEQSPSDKSNHLDKLRLDGHKICMIGDGINDAPALAGAFISMSPTSASDISQTAADILFQGDRLWPIIEIIDISIRSQRLVKQNFALAFIYNILTVPLAMAGLITPLFAAIAMSSSSLIVIANALRLGWFKSRGKL